MAGLGNPMASVSPARCLARGWFSSGTNVMVQGDGGAPCPTQSLTCICLGLHPGCHCSLHAQRQLLGPGCQSPDYLDMQSNPASSIWRIPPGSLKGIKSICKPSFWVCLVLVWPRGSVLGDVVTLQAAILCLPVFSSAKLMPLPETNLAFPEETLICL